MVDLALCHVRLQRDARWPWLVLIPRRGGLTELVELSAAEWVLLKGELEAAVDAAHAVGQVLGLVVDKLNVGALGNVVPQLHLHVVGRRAGDPAWPGPVWGFGAAAPYAPQALARASAAAVEALTVFSTA